jgi:hypothetical protein
MLSESLPGFLDSLYGQHAGIMLGGKVCAEQSLNHAAMAGSNAGEGNAASLAFQTVDVASWKAANRIAGRRKSVSASASASTSAAASASETTHWS